MTKRDKIWWNEIFNDIRYSEINPRYPSLLIFEFPFFWSSRFSEYIITSLSKSHSTQMGGLGLNYLKLMTSPCGANPSATRRNETFKKFVMRVYSWLCWGPSKSMKKILVITACCVWKNRWTWWSKCKNTRQQRQSPPDISWYLDLIVVVSSTEVWFHY